MGSQKWGHKQGNNMYKWLSTSFFLGGWGGRLYITLLITTHEPSSRP